MVIAADDVLAPMLNDIDDVERVLPGTIDVMREWLRLYKTVDGKPENKFGMEERAMGREYTMSSAIVQETHEFWRKLTSCGAEDGPVAPKTLRLPAAAPAGTAPPSSVLPDIRSSSDGCRPATSAPVESRFVLESAGGPPRRTSAADQQQARAARAAEGLLDHLLVHWRTPPLLRTLKFDATRRCEPLFPIARVLLATRRSRRCRRARRGAIARAL